MEPGLGIPPVSQLISEDSRQSTCRSSDWENNSTRCQSGLDWDSHSSKPLNFATNPDDCDIQSVKKPKTPRDPMSHRIIEKRRRDRMNNCLADLSRLIPANYMKQGQGRIEKTEIIEMAIKHIKQLKAKLESFDMADVKKQQVDPTSAYIHQKPCCSEKFYMGFKECEAELMRFLVEREGWDAKDQICSRLMKQLDEASKKYTGNFGSLETFGNDGKKDPDCQQLSIHVYGSSECMSVEPYTSPAPSSVYDGDMLDVMQFRGGNFNGYNMNSDKHLRTLLQKNAEHNSTENESGIASLSTREPEANLSGDLVNGSDKSNSSTIQETLELSEDCRGGCLVARRSDDASTYKFKQNITLRFSEEKRKASDTSSISSREGGTKVKVRRKVAKAKSLSPQSDSSIYPTSDYSSNGNGTSSTGDNPSQGLMPDDHKDIKDEFSLKGASLPGFILHPIGSFYLPISLSESQVSMLGLFTESSLQHHATLLHPISIAVNFGSHSLTMRNINIQSSFAQNRAMFCDGDQMGCQKV